ncbi:unnamed protein product [Pleuronectes platessa]|uniref:Uncharacterized protein n=1 Tax=Pleuronectes platessa TaxID=8262 RepID=A0A9N7ZEK8_PLEPL|nr:unnamed protein product [Pleuronectes platessa]
MRGGMIETRTGLERETRPEEDICECDMEVEGTSRKQALCPTIVHHQPSPQEPRAGWQRVKRGRGRGGVAPSFPHCNDLTQLSLCNPTHTRTLQRPDLLLLLLLLLMVVVMLTSTQPEAERSGAGCRSRVIEMRKPCSLKDSEISYSRPNADVSESSFYSGHTTPAPDISHPWRSSCFCVLFLVCVAFWILSCIASELTMPPTTPYAGKFSSCALYSNNNNNPQPHSPYRNGTASKPAKENIYNSAYSGSENPYDIPQPHGCYRSSSVTSVKAKEHHYTSNYAVSENPYSPPQPRSPRQHSSSCPGRAYRHTTTSTGSGSGSGGSGGSSSEQSCHNNKNVAAGKARLHGHGITASYGEMCYHDNSLVSASLEALIQHLVPTVDYYPDRSYVFTFLLSSRLFLHPYELMTRVCHLCVEQQRSGDALLDKIRFREVAPKLVQLLTEWTETFPYDFRDERMMRCLKDMTHHVARGDEYSWRAMQQMTQRLIKRLSALGQYEEAVAALNAVALERPASLKSKQASGQKSDVMSVCDDPFILAQQLTHIELDRLSFIGPEEFIQTFAMKDPLENHKGTLPPKWPSESAEGLISISKLRIGFQPVFVTALHLRLSPVLPLSGMNMSPIARLKKTWGKVNMDKFEILEHQMDPSSNFTNYRTALRGATQRSETAHSSQEKIVIPFFSLLIKDIYFLNEGCASRLTNGHINFEKLWELAKQVSEFLVWRQVVCPFDRDRRILQYLVTTPVFTEDELHLASYESEGPENHMEKDSRRSLRSSLSHRENRS